MTYLAAHLSMTNMSGTGLLIMTLSILAALAFLLISVSLAARKPYNELRQPGEQWNGPVQGGMFAGDPRSVLPHRDTPAAATSEPPGREHGEDSAVAAQRGQERDKDHQPGSPMAL